MFACDAWHAMTSDRPYRKALPEHVAREELAGNAGTQFDPRAVEAVLEVVGERSGEPAPPSGGQIDAESEENHRVQQLASVAEQTGADDLFVFRLTSEGRYSHVDGTGRGAGWAGNVELDAEHEPAFARAVRGGEPVCLSHDETGRVFGPYYARTAALVPHGSGAVVVLGSAGGHLARVCAEDLTAQTERAVQATQSVPPAKRLADELEVLEAVRAVTAIHAETVEGALNQVAEVVARSLSCEYGAVRVVDDQGEMRVGEASLGWSPQGGQTVESITAAAEDRLEFPLLIQDMDNDPRLGDTPGLQGVTALYAVEFGDPVLGAMAAVHADTEPRGFTLLCRRLTHSVAEAAEVVIRRALAAERLAESRQQALELGQRALRAPVQHRGHADRLGALAVLAQVVDEDALLGRDARALGAQEEDLGLGLVQPDLGGDDHAVVHLGEGGTVVAAGADRVRHQPGPDAGGLGRLHRLDHGRVRLHPGEQPVDQVLAVGHAQLLGQDHPELVLVDVARLDPAQLAAGLLVLGHEPQERVRVQALGPAEQPERVEHVGGQDAAEVDQEPAERRHREPVSAICLACSASAGTPSSNSARYSSSLRPSA